ncbi:acyl-CoA dehydrogenase, partial [Rhizobium ruizarguesonis]
LKHVVCMGEAIANGLLGDLCEDLFDAILAEAGRFATEEVAPIAEIGDRQGARLIDGEVRLQDGWRDLYRHWIAGGWN